jgi:hypothetical protein
LQYVIIYIYYITRVYSKKSFQYHINSFFFSLKKIIATQQDADARIATALGTDTTKPTPSSQSSPSPKPQSSSKSAEDDARCKSTRSCNAVDAENQAKDFAKLNDNSSCTSGENACVKGKFAQCVDGKFVSQACNTGLTCNALPLVNARGTSITCTTDADAKQRIKDALAN